MERKKTLSFGTVTPWGDVEFASSTFTDRRWVNKKENTEMINLP